MTEAEVAYFSGRSRIGLFLWTKPNWLISLDEAELGTHQVEEADCGTYQVEEADCGTHQVEEADCGTHQVEEADWLLPLCQLPFLCENKAKQVEGVCQRAKSPTTS